MDDKKYELFERWVLAPFEALRSLPNGDGAFAVMSMTFGLYERYLISSLKTRGEPANDDTRWKEASADLGGKVSPDDFKSFWEMYRVGMQHCFHPKQFTKGKDKTKWGWDISEEPGFEKYPQILKKGDDRFVITINPWAFAKHVIDRWKEHPELFNEIDTMKSGKIRVSNKTEFPNHGYTTSSESYCTYKRDPNIPDSTGHFQQ
ncbi:hypothetical protein VDG1235_3162 [Verrucomicrobiia bacterium DG1235]|nr:hypothetical protein VDG1235_3162 [Verrucomicrobiae bacterium DG1235]